MGRQKIEIKCIRNKRKRRLTLAQRKAGLIKKAMELSILCDCNIALIICSSEGEMTEYASTEMDEILFSYADYDESNHQALTNNDYGHLYCRESIGKEKLENSAHESLLGLSNNPESYNASSYIAK